MWKRYRILSSGTTLRGLSMLQCSGQKAEEMARSHQYDEVFFDFIREAKGSDHEGSDYDDGGTYAHWYATIKRFKNWVDGTQPI